MYTGVSKDSTDAVIEALTRQPVSIAETDQISFPVKKTSLRTHTQTFGANLNHGVLGCGQSSVERNTATVFTARCVERILIGTLLIAHKTFRC